MFTERLNELLSEVCRTATGEFARIAKYDRSYVTHLRNGDRIPKAGYHASERLARAIYLCAYEKGALEALCDRVGAESDAEEDVCAAVSAWLFEGQTPRARISSGRMSKPADAGRQGGFGKRLSEAMELANISNLRLSRALNVDASVISKYRSGLRVPRVNHPLIHEISVILTSRIFLLERIAGLSRLTGAPQESLADEASGAERLEAWLRDFSTVDTSVIEGFLEGVDRFSPDTRLPLPAPEDAADEAVLNERAEEYRGVDGLRRAVLRFLGRAVREGRKRLLLYSDQSMEWMVADAGFTLRWLSLMSAYVRGGGKITIIHHVDRGLEEMLSAIQSWLPLYISGGIESWYCLRRGGERFAHTLFLEPESACITGLCVAGREKNAVYRYETDAAALARQRAFYDDLLGDCKPLLRMDRGDVTPRLPAVMKDETVHLVGRSLFLGTMPEELLRRILARAELPEETKSAILSDWASQSELTQEKLKSGSIRECVPLPEEKTLFMNGVPLSTVRAALCYTPEEYAEHVRRLLELSERQPGYRLYPLAEAPFEHIELLATERTSVIGCVSDRPVTFTATHPPMCRAFINFAARLEEQYALDRPTLKETLKRYL